MDDAFRHMFEGLKQAADGVILATEGIKKVADAALQVRQDHEDVRDTVHRLETLVLEQGAQIRALHEKLNGH